MNVAQFWTGYTMPVLLDDIQYHHWEGIAVECDKAVDEHKKRNARGRRASRK